MGERKILEYTEAPDEGILGAFLSSMRSSWRRSGELPQINSHYRTESV